VPKTKKEVKKDEERLGRHSSLSPLKVFVEEFPSSENLQPLVKSLRFLKIPIHQNHQIFDASNHCFPSNPAAWEAPGSCSASCSPYARQSCSWWPCPPKLPGQEWDPNATGRESQTRDDQNHCDMIVLWVFGFDLPQNGCNISVI